MARIYVASSWRNANQPAIVRLLRLEGHEVYDFRNPPHGDAGFQWSTIDPDWKEWSVGEHRHHLLTSTMAARGFVADLRGMMWCDTCVLLMPCGRSAHWEAGWCAGQGKKVVVYLSDAEPELMNLLATDIVIDDRELLWAVGGRPVRPIQSDRTSDRPTTGDGESEPFGDPQTEPPPPAVERLIQTVTAMLPPSHGVAGGPLVGLAARYEDVTDENTARCRGWVNHESVRAVRDALAAVQSERG